MLWLIQRDFLEGKTVQAMVREALAPQDNALNDPDIAQVRLVITLACLLTERQECVMPSPGRCWASWQMAALKLSWQPPQARLPSRRFRSAAFGLQMTSQRAFTRLHAYLRCIVGGVYWLHFQ